jgi:hypothetical protein
VVCDFHQNTCALFSFLEAAQGLSHTVVKDSFVDKQFFFHVDFLFLKITHHSGMMLL